MTTNEETMVKAYMMLAQGRIRARVHGRIGEVLEDELKGAYDDLYNADKKKEQDAGK